MPESLYTPALSRPSSSLSILSSQRPFNPLLPLSLCSPRGLLWVRSWVGLSRGWSRGWIGKKWLSQCLINDPSVACPGTLGLHVSTSVHTGRGALFWEEVVSAAHSRLPIKRKRFTVIKGQIKAHNGDIDFFLFFFLNQKIHILGKAILGLERDMISLFRKDNMESSPRMNFERSKL